MRKRLLSLALALMLCVGLCAPAMAAGGDLSVVQVEMGLMGTFVVTSDHSLYTWGSYRSEFYSNRASVYEGLWPDGQYIHATKVMDDVQAVATSERSSIAVSGGLGMLMILKTDGSLWVWGDNETGQLGQGTRESISSRKDFRPVKVMDDVKTMACTGNLCAAVTNSGDLYCWGYILGRPKGTRGTEFKFHYLEVPTKMLSNVTAVSCGYTHTLALTADGTVYAMGDPSNWQLANGTDRGEPVTEMIKVMDGCSAVTAGQSFSLALKSDGTVYAWGENNIGSFGVPYAEADHYAKPTPIMTDVKQMAAGNFNAAFIKTDNSLWITGDNRFAIHGQGNNHYTGDFSACGPVQVDTDVKTVDLRSYAMLYVKNNNVMYGTGSSMEGVPKYTYQDIDGPFRVIDDTIGGGEGIVSGGGVGFPTIAGISRAPVEDITPPKPTATPTSSTVLVNGVQQSFDAYNINGANYFKLRDLAYVLSGTEKQFQVGWDSTSKTIALTSGQSYTAVGGEMASGAAGSQTAAVSNAKLLVDGKEVSLTAYNINGANYFMLRDIGTLFDFGVGWDNASKTITIDTSTGYTA